MNEELHNTTLAALEHRQANRPERIRNDTLPLPAGSPMYFYCRVCGHESDVMPENYTSNPRSVCTECQLLVDNGWLTIT